MKTRPKAMLSAVTMMILSVFLVVAGPVKAIAAEYDEAEIRQTAAFILNQCIQTDDETYEALQNARETDIDFVLLQSGIPCGGKDYVSILTAWRDSQEECGPYVADQDLTELINTFELKERNNEIELAGVIAFEDRDADVAFSFETDGTVTALTIGGQYAPGEVMKKAGLNTVIGMGTVFAVLIFMSLIISCFGLINKIQNRAANKKKGGDAAAENEEQTLQFDTGEEEIEEDVLYVITAAVVNELRRKPLRRDE